MAFIFTKEKIEFIYRYILNAITHILYKSCILWYNRSDIKVVSKIYSMERDIFQFCNKQWK
jgi:hypothetical protein